MRLTRATLCSLAVSAIACNSAEPLGTSAEALVATTPRELAVTTVETPRSAQVHADVAFDGTRYLAVWNDSRDPLIPASIWGARVAADGTVLDPTGIEIARLAGAGERPSVAAIAGTFLVAWATATSPARVEAVRVRSADGVVLDPSPIRVGDYASDCAAGADGSAFLVAFTGESSGVRAVRMGADGRVLDPTPIVIASGVPHLEERSPGIAFDGTRYLVSFVAKRNDTSLFHHVFGMPVGTDGSLGALTPRSFHFSTSIARAAIASAGSGGWMLAWQSSASFPTRTAVHAVAVSATLEPGPVQVLDTVVFAGDLDLAYIHGAFHIAWHTSTELEARRLAPDGAAAGSSSLPIRHSRRTGTALAGGASSALAVFDTELSTDPSLTLSDVRGHVIAPGPVLSPVELRVAGQADAQSAAAAARSGDTWLVTWRAARGDDGDFDLFAARVTSAGEVIDATPIAIETADAVVGLSAVAGSASGWLVVWTDDAYALRGARVALDGTVLDPAGVLIGTGATPRVASDGTDYAVLFTRDGHGTIVYADGTVDRVGGVPVVPTNVTRDIAWTGAEYLAVTASSTGSVEVTSLDRTLLPAGSTAAGSGRQVAIAAGAGGAAIVYRTDVGTWTAQRVGAGGATIGSAIALGAGDATLSPLTATASIAFDGAHYWAAWARRAPSDPLETNRSAIFARRFAPDGSLPDAAEEILLDGPMTDLHPVLAGGSGAVLALEERFVPERPYGAMRVLHALASDAPLMCVGPSDGASCDDGDPCTGPDRCASGACSGAALSCDDGDACTRDACDPASGCDHTAIAGCCRAVAECDDGDACTRDACGGALGCSHSPITGCCASDGDCDDGTACTSDRCDLATARCAADPIPGCCAADADCADVRACTTERCAEGGLCAIDAIAGCCETDGDCDDGDPCSRDTCDGAACAHEPICAPDAGVGDRDAGAGDRDAGAGDRDAGAGERDAGSGARDAGPPEGGGSDCTCGIAARAETPRLALALLASVLAARVRRRRRGHGAQ